jgi:hypothetical protein
LETFYCAVCWEAWEQEGDGGEGEEGEWEEDEEGTPTEEILAPSGQEGSRQGGSKASGGGGGQEDELVDEFGFPVETKMKPAGKVTTTAPLTAKEVTTMFTSSTEAVDSATNAAPLATVPAAAPAPALAPAPAQAKGHATELPAESRTEKEKKTRVVARPLDLSSLGPIESDKATPRSKHLSFRPTAAAATPRASSAPQPLSPDQQFDEDGLPVERTVTRRDGRSVPSVYFEDADGLPFDINVDDITLADLEEEVATGADPPHAHTHTHTHTHTL